MPSAESSARLRSLAKSNIDVKIYQGSGHGLEDPEGKGDRFLREDALRDIRYFIYRSIPNNPGVNLSLLITPITEYERQGASALG